jgi:hypothetical protein
VGVGVLILLIALGTMLKRYTGEPTPVVAQKGDVSPIRDIAVLLLTEHPTQFAGRPVAIRGAVALEPAGQDTFWISDGDSGRVLVFESPSPHRGSVATHQRVDIFGEIRRLPAWQDIPEGWGLDAKNRPELEKHEVYIHASLVKASDRFH